MTHPDLKFSKEEIEDFNRQAVELHQKKSLDREHDYMRKAFGYDRCPYCEINI